MKISKNKVVGIDYTLTNEQGEVLDSSEGQEPLYYIQGTGEIVAGLESALEGKSVGEALMVSVVPEQGYGERDESLLQKVPRTNFAGVDELEVGMEFQAKTPSGMQVVTVVGIEDDQVSIDANHPLAGFTLNFDVKIVDVRDATAGELSHGHAHGPDGAHHH